MVDTIKNAIETVLSKMTPGRAVKFHPNCCDEAVGADVSEWDTSHDVSVILKDGRRYRVATFKHAVDAWFYQQARDIVPAILAEREALKQRLELALMACREIDDIVMHGDCDVNSLALGIMRAHTPARAALGK